MLSLINPLISQDFRNCVNQQFPKGSVHSNASSCTTNKSLSSHATEAADGGLPSVPINNNEYNKENTSPPGRINSSVQARRADGYPTFSDSSTVIVPSHERVFGGKCHHPHLQRSQSHDLKMIANSGDSDDHDMGSLVIERRTSEMSFLITPTPSEHPDYTDYPEVSKGISRKYKYTLYPC